MAHHLQFDDTLAKTGRIKIFLQGLYGKNEEWIIRGLDKILRIRYLNRGGKPVLRLLSRLLGLFMPTAEVVSYRNAVELLEALSHHGELEIAVGPCRCQKSLNRRTGTLEKDIVILFGAETYKRTLSNYRNITLAETKKLFCKLLSEGFVPSLFSCLQSKGWLFAICHCESEICFPLRAHLSAGSVFYHGQDIVRVNHEKCTNCGNCVTRCHFGANSANGKSDIDYSKCYGCGVCVPTCNGKARSMKSRENYRNRYFPIGLVDELQRENAGTSNG